MTHSQFVTRLSDCLEANICQISSEARDIPGLREAEVQTRKEKVYLPPGRRRVSEQLQDSILRTLIFPSLQTLHKAVVCSIGLLLPVNYRRSGHNVLPCEKCQPYSSEKPTAEAFFKLLNTKPPYKVLIPCSHISQPPSRNARSGSILNNASP